MLQKNNMWKVLQVFFNDPNPVGAGFQLREISRKTKLAPPSVKNYLNELSEKGDDGHPLIQKGKHRIYGYPVYLANRESEMFLFYKKLDTLIRIRESGLLNYLHETCLPTVIILFGSAAKGEDVKDSDIDIFVESNQKKLNHLQEFEKQFQRNINIFFADNFPSLSPELKNNVVNGIILKGYLKVF